MNSYLTSNLKTIGSDIICMTTNLKANYQKKKGKETEAHPTAKMSIDGLKGASCATCISPPCS